MEQTDIQDFNDAVEKVKRLASRPDDGELLILYGYYKQSVFGDNKASQPSIFSVKERSKWGAWENNKMMSRKQARQNYIVFVDTLVVKYGFTPIIQSSQIDIV